MKLEFEYWYPFLTFCIYNHTAIFPERHWPRGFRCNGHIMLNSEKMSKSTGNFRTVRQPIEEFSADATRFSLADAGDGVDDANFVFETANAAILRLTKELAWYEENLAAEATLRTGPPSIYADRVFANEINIAVKTTEQNYSNYMFREALKSGFYDLQAARDEYRLSCGVGGLNRDLVWRFMDVQTRLLAPICPHYAEFIWRELLKKDGFVVKAGWPTADAPDLTLKSANKYLQDSIVLIRKLLQKQLSGSKKGNKKGAPVASPKEIKLTCLIYVNEQFDGWKAECLNILWNNFNKDTRTFAPDSDIMEALQQRPQALDLRLPFGEIEVLQENLDLIKRQIGSKDVEDLKILSAADADSVAKAGSNASVLRDNPPSPGSPTAIFLPK
ncbi:unnamed protein product [Trifolium pratense]|uniref:Uncharacterized protein n=1 Tax=Trifolium pratense TaxID=57577 RepID=A0ACB0LYW7_TRIPR|nr:unnamed protein product [Trifolium pratense]